MLRVPIDPPGLRKKLDLQWLKGVWVGRMDENDAHIVLTLNGTVTGKSVRRLPLEFRHHFNLGKKLKGDISDPVMLQAKLLKILPMTVPVRLLGE